MLPQFGLERLARTKAAHPRRILQGPGQRGSQQLHFILCQLFLQAFEEQAFFLADMPREQLPEILQAALIQCLPLGAEKVLPQPFMLATQFQNQRGEFSEAPGGWK